MECCIGIFALCCVLTAVSGFSQGFARSRSGDRRDTRHQQNTEAVRNIALLEDMRD